jgi:hypothetical protein
MDFLSLIGAIPGLISDFKGDTSAPYRKQQEEIANRQNQLSQALTDTNNPLYQQMYGQYKQQNQNNLAQVIAEAQGQNRMNASMGRTPLFNNERGSENIFRTLAQGYQNSGVQADQQTRAGLQQALGGNQAAQQQYGAITPTTSRANAQQLSGYQGIEDIIRQGLGGNQSPYSQQASQQSYNPGLIAWNQPRGSYGQ